MTPPVFPPLTPDNGLTVSQPRHPYVAKQSTGGGETRIRLSNIRHGAKLSLKFSNISTRDLMYFAMHWRDSRGTAREFTISTVSLGGMGSAAKNLLLSVTWKYAGKPSVVDICGRIDKPGLALLHTVEIQLISQPRRVAAYVDPITPELSLPAFPNVSVMGGVAISRTSILGGLGSLTGWSVRGADFAAANVWAVGGKVSTTIGEIPGSDIIATASIEGGRETAGSSASMLTIVQIEGGKASVSGPAPGGNLNAVASVDGGLAYVPSRYVGGGSIVSSATISGGTASLSASDPHFSQVAVLLLMNGENNSTSFVDSSSNPRTFAVFNGAKISTAQLLFGNPSGLFTAGAYIETTLSSAIGLQPFTVEFFIYNLSNTGGQVAFNGRSNTSQNGIDVFADAKASTDSLWIFNDGGESTRPYSGINEWAHIAVVRDSAYNMRRYVKGERIGIVGNLPSNLSSTRIQIGRRTDPTPDYSVNAYIGMFRLTIGTARYTENFVPPSAPFPTQ